MSRKGFTIVELLVVVGVLSILMTIVTVAASGSIKSARERRREAMAAVLREGLSTYYARNGKWPGAIESEAENGSDKWFEGTEADSIFRVVVKASANKSKNPYLDPHALFVAPTGETGNNRGTGVPFDEAISKDPPPHRRRIGIDSMAFGFQDPSKGYFRRYKIHYNAATDSVEVSW